MISNLEYFMAKYIAGPMHKCSEQWYMSDVNTLKYGASRKYCLYFLIFDRANDTVQLKNNMGTVVGTCKFDEVLSFLRERRLLSGWEPVPYLSYTDEDFEKVGYKGKEESK